VAANARPIVVAYDGSKEAQLALRTAAALFPGHRVTVATVWEPALVAALPPEPAAAALPLSPVDVEVAEEADHWAHEHAERVANEGAEVLKGMGVEAEAVAVADERSPAQTIIGVADDRDAAAIVVGPRGHGRLQSAIFGSTSRTLLRHCARPVLIVPHEHDEKHEKHGKRHHDHPEGSDPV
jgi:nucleotide-binding universal stress UspA family protein